MTFRSIALIDLLAAMSLIPVSRAMAEDRQGVLANGIYTMTVAQGAPDVTLNAADVAVLGGNVTLVKMGKGRLIIATDLKSAGYDGEIQVREGYLRAQHNSGALGGTGGGTVVYPGASFEAYDTSASRGNMWPGEPFTFSGSGVDGVGAVYAVNNGPSISTLFMFSGCMVTMAGDATVGYAGAEPFDGSFGLRNCGGGASAGGFVMNGHTLTIHGGSNCGFWAVRFDSSTPGSIRVKSTCRKFTLENQCKLYGDSGNRLILEDGVTMVLQNQCAYYSADTVDQTRWITPWTLVAEGSALLRIGDAYYAYETSVLRGNGWSGPIILGGVLSIDHMAPTALGGRFDNAISGSGGLCFSNGTFRITSRLNSSQRNTFSGTTKICNGAIVEVASLGLLPGAAGGLLSFEGSGRVNVAAAGAATDAEVGAAFSGLLACDGFSVTSPNWWFGQACTISGPLTGVAAIPIDAAGTVIDNVAASDAPHVYIRKADFTFAQSTPVGMVDFRGGSLSIPAGVTVTQVSNDLFVSSEYPSASRLDVMGTLTTPVSASPVPAVVPGRALYSSGTDRDRGIFALHPGGAYSGIFEAGNNSCNWNWGTTRVGSCPRAMQSFLFLGGTAEIRGGASTDSYIGDMGRGAYISIEGDARITSNNRFRGRGGYAVIHQKGGVWARGSTNAGTPRFSLGTNGGTTDILVSGGTMAVTNNQFEICRPLLEAAMAGTDSSITVDGRDGAATVEIVLDASHSWMPHVAMACQPGSLALVNMNRGGVFRTGVFNRTTNDYVNGVSRADITDNLALVNFDGGVLDHNWEYNQRIFNNFRAGTDRVTVFSGGATINVSGHGVSLGAALEAPTGKGVESIPLPQGMETLAAWEYVGAPRVRIMDPSGNGTGATAVAEFDAARGKVTGIRVTSRGNGYSSAVAKIEFGGYTNDFTVAAVLSDNVSGGVCKRGDGILTVDNVCSYTGVTAVAEGVLALGVDNAIDASGAVELSPGATLRLDGFACNCPVRGFGLVKGGSVALADGWSIAANVLDSGVSPMSVAGALSVDSGTAITLAGVDGLNRRKYAIATATGGISGIPRLVGEGTHRWRLYLSADGKTLHLGFAYGMSMRLR